MPAAALAAPAKHDKAAARAAVAKVHALGKAKGVRTGFELTPALARLAAAVPSLTGAERRQAESLLARPDDGQQDPADTHKWAVPEAPASPYCLPHFCVHWVAATGDAPSLTDTDADTVPDYVEQMAGVLENEVFPCENGIAPAACAGQPGLGWREAAPDGGRGGDDRTDVYIQDLFSNERVFGYVATDPGQPREPGVPHFAYIVLDKDYTRYGDGSAESGLAAERVTAAHEYNHVLQNAYDYLEDSWMFESTAVYMEERVYPQINDYLDYVKDWAANTKQPLTSFPPPGAQPNNLKPYGSTVWNLWLDRRYGSAVVRTAWERSVAAGDFAPAAYGAAITGANGAGFADEFARFAAGVAEWNVPGTFPDPYPDVPRDGILPAGSQTSPFALPHATFAFFNVPIPASSPARIRMTATLPDGTAGAVALVGRTGPDLTAGTVTSNLTPMPTGGTAAVELDNPAAFGRITGVVVNSDTSHGDFDFAVDDYVFTKDAQDVVAAVIEPGPPVPVTGTPGAIGDHAAAVKGTVDPHLHDTSWWIEYGRTSSYGSQTAPKPLPGSTLGSAPVAETLAGLRARTTYHYRVIASNAAGTTAGADMTVRTARDVTPPAVAVKVKPQKVRTARTRGALYLLRCSERCLGTAEVRLGRATARKLGLGTVIGKSRVTLEARASSKALRVRLSPAARRKLAGKRTRLTANLRVRVGDESRNRRTVTRRLVLRP
jgi:hypothetical protein